MRAAALAFLFFANTAAAQVLPGVGKQDTRRAVDAARTPWAALGRVQTELGGRCTGALIAPTLVLTAAHCLVAPRSRNLVQPGSVHFLQGYAQGRFVAHARVVRYRVGPGFEPATGQPAAADWALLTLAEPLAGPTLPLWRGAVPLKTPLMLAGYQQDRPEVLLADTDCQVLGGQRGMVVHDCAGTRGSSGAPLLARQGQRWAVLGVASRVARDEALGLAVHVEMLPQD